MAALSPETEALMVQLTSLRMARVKQEVALRGCVQQPSQHQNVDSVAGKLGDLQVEMDVAAKAVDAMQETGSASSSMEDSKVLAEYWTEASEAMLQLICRRSSEAPQRLVVPTLAAADEESMAAAERIAQGLLQSRPGTSAWDSGCSASCEEAARAFARGPRMTQQSLAVDGRRPPTAAVNAAMQQQQPQQPASADAFCAAWRERSGLPAPGVETPHPPQEDLQHEKQSSFRLASSLLPQSGTAKPQKRGPTDTPNMEAISRSVLRSKKADASDTKQQPASAGRDWSEDWLRIADADQLEKIVPALEATIHKGGEKEEVRRQDIAGLKFVKAQIEEVLILPQVHPHLFASALTRPARGLLLFGPPGTGKTMVARWIAAECGATFFNVHASTVMSKWVGEAEKTVKALFQLARERQPSVIFVDEIDSLLNKRREADNEGSRRVKNEFLTSLEGADTAAEEKVLLVGATNLPWELDTAALRRLPKRLYVPLPCHAARMSLLRRQLAKHSKAQGLDDNLSQPDLERIAARTEGFSGSDLQALLQEAAMRPVREARAALGNLRKRVATAAGGPAPPPRNIQLSDLEAALQRVTPSFNASEADNHHKFNEEYGTFRGEEALVDAEDSAAEDDADDHN